jgi:hypothetical protein
MNNVIHIVQLVHAGEIPRDSGVQLLMLELGVSQQIAEKVMASAGLP